jgi:hypothetical protein
MYLISAPAKEINVDLIKELGTYIKNMAPEAVIRSGDYPREKGVMDVTLILSELSDIEKIRNYFSKAISRIRDLKKRQEGLDFLVQEISLHPLLVGRLRLDHVPQLRLALLKLIQAGYLFFSNLFNHQGSPFWFSPPTIP